MSHNLMYKYSTLLHLNLLLNLIVVLRLDDMKSTITIEYCPKCGWLLRAAYFAQEFLTTFHKELIQVSLKPSEINGSFKIFANEQPIFDRKEFGGFPETKELKQLVRNHIAPEKKLGHTDTPTHRIQ